MLPARSTALPVTELPAPSVKVTGPEQPANPDSASLHEKLTVTSVLFQPAAFAVTLRDATIDGAVSSIFRIRDTDARFPARSAIVADAVWFAPSPKSCGDGQLPTRPEPESLQVNVTITSLLFQPAAFGCTLGVAVIDGATLSILMFDTAA